MFVEVDGRVVQRKRRGPRGRQIEEEMKFFIRALRAAGNEGADAIQRFLKCGGSAQKGDVVRDKAF